MADETKVDDRFLYIKERITAAFPKLTGPKFEKQIAEEAIRYMIKHDHHGSSKFIYEDAQR